MCRVETFFAKIRDDKAFSLYDMSHHPCRTYRNLTDTFDKKTRSRIMRAVRVADTDPERRLEAALRAHGLKFRKNDTRVFGVPDFTFRSARVAVFVDGDFWHGRTWFASHAAPATNTKFWIDKFERNGNRDMLVNRRLRRSGWSVLRLWASDVRKDPAGSANKVHARLRRRRLAT